MYLTERDLRAGQEPSDKRKKRFGVVRLRHARFFVQWFSVTDQTDASNFGSSVNAKDEHNLEENDERGSRQRRETERERGGLSLIALSFLIIHHSSF
jgi:hypothetical protein